MTRAAHVETIIRKLDTAIPEARLKLKALNRDGEKGLRPIYDIIEAAAEAAGELMLRVEEKAP